MDFIILGDSIALPQCMGFLCVGRLEVSQVISNSGENCNFGMVLYFELVWLVCYTDGHFLEFMILWDSVALPRCMGF